MTPTAPTIHLVDDDDSMRTALMRVLEAAGHRVRSYASAAEFLMALPITHPGCLVLDVRMPGPSGLELQSALQRQGHDLPIVFLTGHGDIPMSVQAMKDGAVDFLTKPVKRDDLLSAVATALAVDSKRRSRDQTTGEHRSRFDTLTPREREVLALVVEGRLNKQIALALGIAERTVKAHRAGVMSKMGVESLADLVRAAGHLGVDRNGT